MLAARSVKVTLWRATGTCREGNGASPEGWIPMCAHNTVRGAMPPFVLCPWPRQARLAAPGRQSWLRLALSMRPEAPLRRL
jgi:hypothetical protein